MTANLAKFLDLIAWAEGTSRSPLTHWDGYDVIVSGPTGGEVFKDFAAHPFDKRPPKLVSGPTMAHPGGLYSTASGRYQVLQWVWDAYQKQLHLPDFSPVSQDTVAVQQLKERKALPMIERGDVEGAIAACSNIWASLPGNDYAQNAHPMAVLVAQWNKIKPNGLEVA